MTDEGGVLGNLPNSRPGRRSAKRETGAKRTASAGRPAKVARTSAKPGARAAGKASPKRTAAVKGAGSGDRAETPGDAVGAVARGAAGIAVTGARVAGAVTQELLRRLRRP
jgi:hypothetical protein